MSAKPERPGSDDTDVEETAGNDPATESADDGPEAEIGTLKAKADENWDLYLRAAAELENVRKRASRDVENAHRFALENFAKELLAVADSLEMGLEAAESADAAALREGSEATLKLLSATLQRFGVDAVDPEGEPFDPQLHEAMSMMPSAEAEPGSVMTVVQKGYTLNGRLLRPARVIVAEEPPGGDG